jgi:hypothetical protein
MPFTISHVAAVLPFFRLLARWRVVSAAVIGSMVPDFHLFLPWHLQRFETHSLVALFTFCMPVGLFTYWLFQLFIKAPLLEMLPNGAFNRWRAFGAPASVTDPLQWLLATVCLLFGALTHLVWDAFTHEDGRGVRMLPQLDDPILQVGHHHIMGYRALQNLGSLVALFAVLCMFLYGLRRGAAQSTPRMLSAVERALWWLGFAFLGVSLVLLCYETSRLAGPSVGGLIYDMAIASLRGLAIAILVMAATLKARLHYLRRKRS